VRASRRCRVSNNRAIVQQGDLHGIRRRMAHLGDPVWEFLIDVSKYFAAASYRTIKEALWRFPRASYRQMNAARLV
jgi:hypothetical protein